MASEPMIEMLKIRPSDCDGGWLIVEAAKVHATMRDYNDGERDRTWHVEVMPDMTQEQLNALPEFDGW